MELAGCMADEQDSPAFHRDHTEKQEVGGDQSQSQLWQDAPPHTVDQPAFIKLDEVPH